MLKPGEIPIAAQLVSVDEMNDLALVKSEHYLGGTTAKFNAGSQPKAGSEIVVYGFPLAGTLSTSGNVVTGNITALAGLGNDSRLFQISAPVQPGNSGGPVIDRHGNVVAVIVSKLNVMEMAKVTGDISQNVNFAIKGNIATNFMEGVGVKFQTESATASLDTPAIGERAQGYTYLVECQN
jgi:serine protease Do